MTATLSDRAHAKAVAALTASYAAIAEGTPVRLAKRTSNLFRPRTEQPPAGLDVAGLDGVLAIDPVARTADVQGMCTYERLVAECLRHGLMPKVVPQLKTITLGGAVTGLGIESSSFRNGLPHESVLEMDVLTGDGRLLTVSPSQHPDLFAGFPNSYGSLGYAVRLLIELDPVRAVRRPAQRPVRRPRRAGRGDRPDHRRAELGRRAGRLPRRGDVRHRPGLPVPGPLGGQPGRGRGARPPATTPVSRSTTARSRPASGTA